MVSRISPNGFCIYIMYTFHGQPLYTHRSVYKYNVICLSVITKRFLPTFPKYIPYLRVFSHTVIRRSFFVFAPLLSFFAQHIVIIIIIIVVVITRAHRYSCSIVLLFFVEIRLLHAITAVV